MSAQLSRRALVGWAFAAACSKRPEPLRVAVASNFLPLARRLAADFERERRAVVECSGGATGALAAQIESGAPFDVFLAADDVRPLALHRAGLAEAPFEYARGKLALVVSGPGAPEAAALDDPSLRHLAIANPKLAPYGVAARSFLQHTGRWARLADRIVLGENVTQALHFVQSGAAQAGLVPEALARDAARPFWSVPTDSHAPIVQHGALLSRSTHPLAQDFIALLLSPASQRLISAAGYAERVG